MKRERETLIEKKKETEEEKGKLEACLVEEGKGGKEEELKVSV